MKLIFKILFNLNYQIIIIHKLSHFLFYKVKIGGRFLAYIIHHFLRVYSGCDISPKAYISNSLILPHPTGIVIGDGVIIHENVMVWQQVTIGSTGKKNRKMEYPIIENNVRIYAKASILGPIRLGTGCVIGAHSLVISDIPAGETAIGTPARIMKKQDDK